MIFITEIVWVEPRCSGREILPPLWQHSLALGEKKKKICSKWFPGIHFLSLWLGFLYIFFQFWVMVLYIYIAGHTGKCWICQSTNWKCAPTPGFSDAISKALLLSLLVMHSWLWRSDDDSVTYPLFAEMTEAESNYLRISATPNTLSETLKWQKYFFRSPLPVLTRILPKSSSYLLLMRVHCLFIGKL